MRRLSAQQFARLKAAKLSKSTGVKHRAKLLCLDLGSWSDRWWEVQRRTDALMFGRWKAVKRYETWKGY